MSELVVEFLKEINIAQLVAVGVMLWFFYNRLDGKIERLDNKLSRKIEDLDNRLSRRIEELDNRLSRRIEELDNRLSRQVENLSEKVEDVDRRLCRIEGSLASQGHCLFSRQNQPEKQAE